MAEEWFRTAAWDEAERASFEIRLRRARDFSRSQYLRIKALALDEAGNAEAAQELLLRVLTEYPESLDAGSAAELLGDIAHRQGALNEALRCYRESLRVRPDMNATSGTLHISIAEVLNLQGEHRQAVAALELHPKQPMMNHSLCRWNVAMADAADALGDRVEAMRAADRALELLEAPDQFRHRPGIGRAALNETAQARMRRIASGAPAKNSSRWSLALKRSSRAR